MVRDEYLMTKSIIGRKEIGMRESEFSCFGSVSSFDDEHGGRDDSGTAARS